MMLSLNQSKFMSKNDKKTQNEIHYKKVVVMKRTNIYLSTKCYNEISHNHIWTC